MATTKTPAAKPEVTEPTSRVATAETKKGITPKIQAQPAASQKSRPQLAAPQIPESNQAPNPGNSKPSVPVQEVPSMVSMAPPQPKDQIFNTITERELKDLMNDFVRGYEAGDLNSFMKLFAEDARTNDQSSRQGIRKDYQELFQGTEKRQFLVNNLRWKKEDNNRATGEGDFQVIVQAPGALDLTIVSGKVSINVQKGPQGIVIKRLVHMYTTTGTE